MKILAILFIFLTSINFAQELNCKVTVNYESIPVSSRELLVNFKQAVEDYLNNTKFTDNWTWNKIECEFTIVMLTSSSDINYTAQAIVTSKRDIYKSPNKSLMLTINDNQWGFSYEKDQPLYSNRGIFDPLTSFLDYYAYMIIGYDQDSWEELGGSDMYRKAFDIVNMGASNRFSTGWDKNSNSYSRRGFVEDLTNEKYRQFREAFYVYHYGIDYYVKNESIGQQKIVEFINVLDNMRQKFSINSVLTKVFFDAKYGEIIEKLRTYPDKEIFVKLKKIDPGHSSKYQEAMDS